MAATLYLIPTSLSGKPFVETYPEEILSIIRGLEVFVVETPKIGRSFLRGLNKDRQVSQLRFIELNENSQVNADDALKVLMGGESVGVISDAGYPGIADMGSNLVKFAQKEGIHVKCFFGPSSILQTLAASGLNGQNFKFNGYAPKDQIERVKYIKNLEIESIKTGYAQIFIETPYRAQYLFEDIINNLNSNSLLCLGINIDHDTEEVVTKTVADWKAIGKNINKSQVVYIVQGRV
ncbi:MAG TPA: SAM-dependent methyltransferase [Candidatus Dojkabacteria bacterium]|nr:SAM-dependent methyltransferase [Candidatus Dojkabacteria bacterium]